MFVYFYLRCLPDTFFKQIIYFPEGKEADLTMHLKSTFEMEYKK
jgi:hypothetical protein